jgi:preprotein translocase subunit SecF
MNIIGKRKIWYSLSSTVIFLGFIAFSFGGLKPGLDFTGGSIIEVKNLRSVDAIAEALKNNKLDYSSIEETSSGSYFIKTKITDEAGRKKIFDSLSSAKLEDKEIEEIQSSTIGATVSQSITTKAYMSIALGLIVIIIYIGYVFKRSSQVFSSWKYGVSASVAMFHDALIIFGLFSVLGYFYGIEVDSLFVTAILTVMSFSIHDTIVIFDRVRENLKTFSGDFEQVVNKSVSQMISRSINTSIVVIFVVLSLFVFGGESIRYFVLALLFGMVIGTYSSICIASPLLVTWKKFDDKRKTLKQLKP